MAASWVRDFPNSVKIASISSYSSSSFFRSSLANRSRTGRSRTKSFSTSSAQARTMALVSALSSAFTASESWLSGNAV